MYSFPSKNTLDLIKFYYYLFLSLVPTILFGTLFPVIIKQCEFWGINPSLSQKAIISINILLSTGIAARIIKNSWHKFINERNIMYRLDIISFLIFTFYFVILNSGLFLFINTKIPLCQFFLGKTDFYTIGKWTLLINAAIATCAAIIFALFHGFYMIRHRMPEKIPLWSSTFILSIVPVALSFIPVFLFAEQGFASYVFISIFPFILALLAILGYSHPENKLSTWIGKVLFITAIFSCFFGFALAMMGFLWHLSKDPELPSNFITLSNPEGLPLDWSMFNYSPEEYGIRWKKGFIWEVLTGIFFMELGPGFLTVLTIFRYQVFQDKNLNN